MPLNDVFLPQSANILRQDGLMDHEAFYLSTGGLPRGRAKY